MKWRAEIPGQIAIATSIVLFAASLKMPAFLFQSHEPVKGFTLLVFGWLGIMTGDFLPWLANPAYALALTLIFLSWYRSALVVSGIALILALLSLLTREWMFDEGGGTFIVGHGLGFYLWLTAILLLLLTGWAVRTYRTASLGAVSNSQSNK